MDYIESKKKILKDIKEMKNGSLEQMLLITFYSLSSYFKSLIVFGNNSKITKDNINVIREMFYILRNERTLLNYILKHIDEFDVAAVENVIAILDNANDESVYFYYDVLDDILDATETGQEFRGLRRKETIPSLISSLSYAKRVVALGTNIDDIKSFLGFEEEFWEFIKYKVKVINFDDSIEESMVYATPLCDDGGNVADILIMVPKVVDLESSLLAIKIYTKAYRIYKALGKNKINCGENDGVTLDEKYQDEYLLRKVYETFNGYIENSQD